MSDALHKSIDGLIAKLAEFTQASARAGADGGNQQCQAGDTRLSRCVGFGDTSKRSATA